ncbi:hypothetical protein ANCCAN_29315 [Ancylostoma caninum]|uniref:Uncharacterized protein n=1 Tax=Ancylostoma caninum TaxID=29170 RepID=A0A368EYZ0_ANCCA|nr:hypothetical protein ANCCAN_29315 [Ancylostoma caninum]
MKHLYTVPWNFREAKKVIADEVIKSILSQSYDTRIRPPSYDDNGNNGPVIIDVQCYVRRDMFRPIYSNTSNEALLVHLLNTGRLPKF